MTSAITERARRLVGERLPEARTLGESLAELIDEPDAFVAVLRDGLLKLADDAYAAEQERVAPGSGSVFGVRNPLLDAVARQLRQPLRQSSPASALWLAERLFGEEERELVVFSHVALGRSLPDDPERSWQLMRRLARRASDWISVDSLSGLVAQGILMEPFRWAELEQLVYSADRWERRLVGSTIARLPYELQRPSRPSLTGSPGLTLIKSLLGDAEPDVQKSLSWALRSWNEVDQDGVRELIREETERTRETDDGHRAWVLRDALTWPALDPAFVGEIRDGLQGIRRRTGAPSTSTASAVAGAFVGFDRLAETTVAQQGVRSTGRLVGSVRPESMARARDVMEL